MKGTVIMACRNYKKATDAIARIQNKCPSANVQFMQLDLGDFKSIENFVNEFTSKYKGIDILINNAGLGGKFDYKTKQGFEMVMGVNFIGPVYLTELLVNHMKDKSRIINVSSRMHEKVNPVSDPDNFLFEKKFYRGGQNYNRSKLGNIYFTKIYAEKYQRFKSVSLTPGLVITSLWRNMKWYHWIFAGISCPFWNILAKNENLGA